MSQVNALTR